jgi:recombinational DNA repair protein (RecF pathway)
MGRLDSIFNCQNCSKTLWLKYYKLPDGRTVCPKCFDFLIRTGEIEKIKIRLKKFENEKDLLSALNRKEVDG